MLASEADQKAERIHEFMKKFEAKDV